MFDAPTPSRMSPTLLKVAARAKREPDTRFNSQAHLIDVPALARAYTRMRKDAAVGVDGVTKETYGQDCSYGFRPGHSTHDALRSLDRIAHRGEVSWVLEADIKSFFDSLDRNKLLEMLPSRVVHGSLLRLIGKCLHVGTLDGAQYSTPQTGTAQGSVLSPLPGNICLHCVLDHRC